MTYSIQYALGIAVAVLLAIVTAIVHLDPGVFVAAGLDPTRIQAWATIALSVLGAIALFVPRLQAPPTPARLNAEAMLRNGPPYLGRGGGSYGR